MYKSLAPILCVATLAATAAEEPPPQPQRIISHVMRPAKRAATEERIESLKVAEGFRLNVFATNQGNARMMLLLPDGTVLLTKFNEGEVVALRDRDRDGVAEQHETVAKIDEVHGLALHSNVLFLASTTKVFSAPIEDGGRIGKPKQFATLPDGGQHPRRTMGVHDSWLYVSVGSTCNNCEEKNPEHATMLRMRSDGSERSIFASGLRNTIGFDWHPVTMDFWGMDHGSDDRGNDTPPEELNQLIEGKHYGWPYCHSDRVVDPIANATGINKDEFCAQSEPPALHYQAHAAPIAFVFYNAELFPEDFRGDAFVAMHGSWNRNPAVGYSVVRVKFTDGKPDGFEDFLSGWLIEEGRAHFGRPAGLVVAADGSLLISDDANGLIYRVSR